MMEINLVYFVLTQFECYTIQITKPLAWASSIDPSGHFDYLYGRINQLHVEDFVVEIPPWSFHFFVNGFFSKFFVFTLDIYCYQVL